jgi:hypothetical protein
MNEFTEQEGARLRECSFCKRDAPCKTYDEYAPMVDMTNKVTVPSLNVFQCCKRCFEERERLRIARRNDPLRYA